MSHEDLSREELFADPDEIVAFAQAYYATEFPNSERRACPPAATLRKAAHAVTLPDARLRAHLFSCSECFRSFRSARISHSPQTAAEDSPPRRALRGAFASLLTPKLAFVRAAAVGLALLGVTAAILVWRTGEEPVDVAMNNQQVGVAAPTTQVPSPPAETEVADHQPPSAPQKAGARVTLSTQPRRAKRRARVTQAAPSLPVIRINLQEENLLRDADEAGGKPRLINLTPRRRRLRLQLPVGSAEGRYAVRVVDAFGKSVITTSAQSDGRTLAVDLDLRGVTAKRYRLCVARDGEAPDCYVVSVNDQTRRALK